LKARFIGIDILLRGLTQAYARTMRKYNCSRDAPIPGAPSLRQQQQEAV
jgi:hypothetical protein